MSTLAEEIREYVLVAMLEPARRRGERVVRVRAGDVHRGMGLEDRMPAVCGALDAARFLELADVTLISREGPEQGANASWTFGIEP